MQIIFVINTTSLVNHSIYKKPFSSLLVLMAVNSYSCRAKEGTFPLLNAFISPVANLGRRTLLISKGALSHGVFRY